MFASLVILAAAAGVATAAPASAPTCSPQFQGSSVYIYNAASGLYWTVPSYATAQTAVTAGQIGSEWDFTSASNGQYTVLAHGSANHNLIIGPGVGGAVTLRTVKASKNPSYTVSCSSCSKSTSTTQEWASGSTIATGCTISNSTTSYQVSQDSSNNLKFAAGSSSGNQVFNFVAA